MGRIDIAVIGAGAAGLAAARALRRRGHDVVVLEARDRIGGRIFTHRDPRVPLPIELGAEFVHGQAPETMRILAEAGLLAYDIGGDFWRADRGRLRRADFWDQINQVLQRIDPERPDESFAAFLARRPGGRSLAAARAHARDFVQGFHAADLDQISVRSIAPVDDQEASEAAASSAGILQGYDQIPRWLARELETTVRLSCPVTAIDWEPGRAELRFHSRAGASGRLAARAVVITVPLGVLGAPSDQPGGLALVPDPPHVRRAIGLLAMGSVIHLTIWFRDFPWAGLHRIPDERGLRRLRFLFTSGAPFPVWWTTYPLRWPLAVAWCGGPPAARLARRKREQIEDAAILGLAETLGVPRRLVASRVEQIWGHDWERDPFARGAYSYARVGGASAARTLARPVAATLFFAGEATDTGHRTGTVEGAIASGLRAARQVDVALGRE